MEWVTLFIWLGVLLLFCLGVIVGFMIYWTKVYRYRIRYFFNLSGEKQYSEGKTFRARKVYLDKGTPPRLWVPRLREFVSYFGKKMGKNLYYYAEGPDGYLYNIVLGDLDTNKGILDVEPIDKDLRDFYITNQKNINERYNKPKSWPLILQSISIVLAVLILVVGSIIAYDKINEGLDKTNSNLKLNEDLLERQKELMAGIDRVVQGLKGGKTGLVPAPSET